MKLSSGELIKPKAILFDLDGTLIEFPKDFLFSQAYQVFESLSLAPTPADLMEEAFKEFDFFRIAPLEIRDDFIAAYWQLFDWDKYPRASKIDGVEETLSYLKGQGFELAIVTSRNEQVSEIENRLSSTTILENISFIVPRMCPDSEWSDKTKQILEASRRLNMEPEEIAVIGDIPPDIESGHRCGVGTKVALLSGGIKRQKLLESKPDFLFSNVNELRGLF